MKKILVTGANGYIASFVRKENPQFEWILMTRKDADLSNPDSVEAFLNTQDFDICFHTAANATTAICEEQPELAHKINVESTQKIIEACQKKGARLIFCGTEQSFNGKVNHGPFVEEEPLEAVTVYGQNKMECEELIRNQLSDYVILRFSWMMGLSFDGVKASPNIIKNVMHALLTNTPTLFTVNEKRGMTYAKKLAKQFDKIVNLPTDIYHVSNYNQFTTYESAVYVAKQLNANEEQIQKLILPNHERYADRFRDYRLDTKKIESFGITFGTFEENVKEVLSDFGWN
ncbi:MAG: sugar nucleotide-binding protein [Bacillota bacterium]|nr:sugar nucleotide-binding protein [Bacillota bacterium]